MEKFEVEDANERTQKEKIEPRTYGLSAVLFKYSNWKDTCLVLLGTIGCITDGSSYPLVIVCLSRIMNRYSAGAAVTLDDINEGTLTLLYVAIGVGLGAFLEGLCWARAAERQASRLRTKYLKAVLRQDANFLDTRKGTTYQVVSSITTDTLTIQSVLSEKVPHFIMNITTFVMCQLVSLYLCWRLAVITIPTLLLLIVPGIVYGKLLAGLGGEIQEAYGVAGGIAEQAFSSIRTVLSYVAEDRTEKRFSDALQTSLVLGIKQGLIKGFAIGSVGVAFAVWSFQAWYGSKLVTEKGLVGGDVFASGVCIVVGGLALGSSFVHIKYFTEATAAATQIFEMIEHIPTINSESEGKIMAKVKGELEFKNVDFAYPSRPNSKVLRSFNLRVAPGLTVGLVGGSGSGKSTVISLIERFYDPLAGEVTLDGIDIRKFQLKWLRSQIGLVSQEPILFATSIKENIMIGKEDASLEEVVRASMAANSHNFISQLPDGYDTQVGQLGAQMSGGQKQRISIARALLRDPRILLLDEATSALDSQSEKVVQDALDQASIGRTTIIVAHRLSTLRNADMIVVVQSGKVVEFGSNEQLLQRQSSRYSAMLHLQKTSMKHRDAALTPPRGDYGSPISFLGSEDTEEPLNKSFSSKALGHKGTKGEEDSTTSPSLWRLVQMTTPQWKRTVIGVIAALCFGIIHPIQSFTMGALLGVYFLGDPSSIRSKTKTVCLVFIFNFVYCFITNVIQHYNFGVMGENLTKRVRGAMLAKIMTFEVEWFDQVSNNSGALCARLATEANMVRSLVCDRLSLIAQVTSAAFVAVIMSMVLSWRLAILIIALQPLVIGSFYARGILMKNMSKKVLKAQSRSSSIASEAITNHRTIAAFSSEDKIMGLFNGSLQGPKSESVKQSRYAGIGLMISQFLLAANGALIMWYGGKLLLDGKISYKHLFQIFFVLVTAGRVIAEAGSTTSDLTKGRRAVKSVFKILDRKSKIEPDDRRGFKPQTLEGSIKLVNVYFSYPSRPTQMIFKGLSLMVEPRTTVALVGQSGSGKSSIISLIERFYDPRKGSVEIDGENIKSYNLRALRSHIALVSQEPTLFAGTIYENITYGKENATEAEITQAAALANAHEFISGMEKGYETYCGERGVQLSGGQKQRICLARAILKNPAILLLDEATSALDNRSEVLVQDALEKMMINRTCVVVAHRLSTIQKADSIAVIENGAVIEKGSHKELLAKGEAGSYYSLVKIQGNDNLGFKTPERMPSSWGSHENLR